jgi:succinyl-CoA synthetase beta subunit
MNIHEYQAKALLSEYGIPVPVGHACQTVDQCVAAAADIHASRWVIKAQVHAGGRGKAGGVKLADTLAAVREQAAAILGMTLVSRQTGPEGRLVRRLLVEAGVDIERELYLGMLVDRGRQQVALLASTEGGTEIEEVAASSPDKILTAYADIEHGFRRSDIEAVIDGLGLDNASRHQAILLIEELLRLFVEKDASLIEINPLVVTGKGELLALDAKMNFDDNALFRHPEIRQLDDPDEQDPDEIEAAAHGLSYVSLDGNIGCMVNGAGLAMATMDIIKLYGGEPANFLDVGGGASAEQVTQAFRLMLKNPRVQAILVNIFGGIMRCDVIAEGIIAAARDVQLGIPLVVRLEGTNVDIGRQMLRDSGLDIISAGDMADAARKAVQAAGGEA